MHKAIPSQGAFLQDLEWICLVSSVCGFCCRFCLRFYFCFCCCFCYRFVPALLLLLSAKPLLLLQLCAFTYAASCAPVFLLLLLLLFLFSWLPDCMNSRRSSARMGNCGALWCRAAAASPLCFIFSLSLLCLLSFSPLFIEFLWLLRRLKVGE